eukprot:7256536-Prymnesium_polylepis.1
MLYRTAILACVLAVNADMTCPSTSAWVAAGMKLTTTAATSCDKVGGGSPMPACHPHHPVRRTTRGTPALSTKPQTLLGAPCQVLAEMKARVAGQYGAWHDPHNNGTYSVQSYGGTFSTSRLTGDGKYTDKQIFTLTTSGDSCVIEACSRSQVTSYLDYGTNYCDVKVLVCGSADGCAARASRPAAHHCRRRRPAHIDRLFCRVKQL